MLWLPFLFLPTIALAAPSCVREASALARRGGGGQDIPFYKGHNLSSLKMLVDGRAIYKDM